MCLHVHMYISAPLTDISDSAFCLLSNRNTGVFIPPAPSTCFSMLLLVYSDLHLTELFPLLLSFCFLYNIYHPPSIVLSFLSSLSSSLYSLYMLILPLLFCFSYKLNMFNNRVIEGLKKHLRARDIPLPHFMVDAFHNPQLPPTSL